MLYATPCKGLAGFLIFGSPMTDDLIDRITPEERARVEIDRMLGLAGWDVQYGARVNLTASRGVAVKEFILPATTRAGRLPPACQWKAAGVVEYKQGGSDSTLTGAKWQSAEYGEGLAGTENIKSGSQNARQIHEECGRL